MISPELLQHIQDSERCVLHPYLDPVGLPTIGWGHRIPDLDEPTLTQAQADTLLEQDVEIAQAQALQLSPNLTLATQAREDAIVDFCFNAGAGHYAGSTLRKRVAEENWLAAAAEMRRWVYGHNPDGALVKLPGLVTRREACARWLETGGW